MASRPEFQVRPGGIATILRLKCLNRERATRGPAVVLGGTELPSRVGSTVEGESRWLSIDPGEWLAIVPQQAAAGFRDRLATQLPDSGLAVADLTDGLAQLEVEGKLAAEVLSKGCGLDFHLTAFPAGHCARTRFAQIPLVLVRLDGPPRFELYVARSHARYLNDWINDAAAEFQL